MLRKSSFKDSAEKKRLEAILPKQQITSQENGVLTGTQSTDSTTLGKPDGSFQLERKEKAKNKPKLNVLPKSQNKLDTPTLQPFLNRNERGRDERQQSHRKRKQKRYETIGIITHNAKGIPQYFAAEVLHPYLEKLKDEKMQIIGFSEPNLNWHREDVQTNIRRTFQQSYYQG